MDIRSNRIDVLLARTFGRKAGHKDFLSIEQGWDFFNFWSPLSSVLGSNQAKNVNSIYIYTEIPHTVMHPQTSIIVPLILGRC